MREGDVGDRYLVIETGSVGRLGGRAPPADVRAGRRHRRDRPAARRAANGDRGRHGSDPGPGARRALVQGRDGGAGRLGGGRGDHRRSTRRLGAVSADARRLITRGRPGRRPDHRGSRRLVRRGAGRRGRRRAGGGPRPAARRRRRRRGAAPSAGPRRRRRRHVDDDPRRARPLAQERLERLHRPDDAVGRGASRRTGRGGSSAGRRRPGRRRWRRRRSGRAPRRAARLVVLVAGPCATPGRLRVGRDRLGGRDRRQGRRRGASARRRPARRGETNGTAGAAGAGPATGAATGRRPRPADPDRPGRAAGQPARTTPVACAVPAARSVRAVPAPAAATALAGRDLARERLRAARPRPRPSRPTRSASSETSSPLWSTRPATSRIAPSRHVPIVCS